MKKIMTLVLMFTLLCFINGYAKTDKFETGELPKEIKIISQSSQQVFTYITAIDLSNNELIIIQIYNGQSYACLRTGIICDPKKQDNIIGSSAPFESKK